MQFMEPFKKNMFSLFSLLLILISKLCQIRQNINDLHKMCINALSLVYIQCYITFDMPPQNLFVYLIIDVVIFHLWKFFNKYLNY